MFERSDLGKLVLRLTLGGLLLFHGLNKLLFGTGMIEYQLAEFGLITYIAYALMVVELVAPLMVILGFFTSAGAFLIFISMITTVTVTHGDELFTLGVNGGWAPELQTFFTLCAVAVFLLGPGRYKLRN